MRFLAIAILLAATPALAQQRPAVEPTRDVTVTYQMTGATRPGAPPGPHQLRIQYSAAEHRLRVESLEQRQGFAIMDRAARNVTVVMLAQHKYMLVPMHGPEQAFLMDDPKMRFTRGASITVAGLPCTVWKVADAGDAARNGSACITADGVLLRGEDGRGTHSITASKVEYGALPAALFDPPAGFERIEMPTMARPRP